MSNNDDDDGNHNNNNIDNEMTIEMSKWKLTWNQYNSHWKYERQTIMSYRHSWRHRKHKYKLRKFNQIVIPQVVPNR